MSFGLNACFWSCGFIEQNRKTLASCTNRLCSRFLPCERAVSVFNLDLKRAETALNSGRLEEACRILKSSTATRHANGQKMIDRLVGALVDRSEKNFEQENFAQARRDAELAAKLGGRQLRVTRMLMQVDAKERSIARHASSQHEQRISEEVSRLVATGQHEEAISRFRKLQRDGWMADQFKQLIEPSVTKLTERANEDLVSGLLDRCETTLRLLNEAGIDGSVQQEVKVQLNRCYNVRRAVEESDYVDANRHLKLLARKLPEATWISDMLDSVQVCLDRVECVKAGPFGLLGQASFLPPEQRMPSALGNWNKRRRMNRHGGEYDRSNEAGPSAVRSILQVDQLGSLLLVQGDICSVGAATASRCDVTLQTEGSKDRILICRDGEDYFATSQQPFFVNDLLASRHLLEHSDSIHIGKRGRLKYSRPVAASSTAVLQITGSKMKRRDIRAIVLVDDVVVFGQNRGHFRMSGFDSPIMLRAMPDTNDGFLIHQQGETLHQPFPVDSALQIHDCQFSLSSTQTTGSIS